MTINREYFSIADAARIIGCTEEDLIHLGANKKIEIWALFAYGVDAERDDRLDDEFGGPKRCFGAGPFLLDPHELKALEAGNHNTWCRTIWTRDGDSDYAFRLKAKYSPGIGHEIDTPNKLVLMARDIEHLSSTRTESQEQNTQGDSMAVDDIGSVTVTLSHMTKSLEAVFKVMWENWKDPDPRRLPKQINIARELDAALGYKPEKDGTPSRNAKAIAAIIKPDMIHGTE